MTAAEARQRDRAEVVSVHLSGSLAPVQVMRTWYRTQTFPKHTHPYFTLGLMRQGAGTLWCAGTARSLHPGDVVIIAPGDVHTGGLGDDGGLLSYVALHVPVELVTTASQSRRRSDGVEQIRSEVTRDPVMAAALRRIDRALSASDDGAASSASAVAIDLLVRRDRGEMLETARSEPAFVRHTRALIESCYAENARTSLDALASSAAVSPFHLVREFTRAVGLSPHQYLIQTRVRRACELLASRSAISDVAASVGFVDQSHLTAHFRRYVGTTPAAYQRGVSRGG
jgi:AraC-like DNA-binding protein/quercetin dioxygenase-like cupin family protein